MFRSSPPSPLLGSRRISLYSVLLFLYILYTTTPFHPESRWTTKVKCGYPFSPFSLVLEPSGPDETQLRSSPLRRGGKAPGSGY